MLGIAFDVFGFEVGLWSLRRFIRAFSARVLMALTAVETASHLIVAHNLNADSNHQRLSPRQLQWLQRIDGLSLPLAAIFSSPARTPRLADSIAPTALNMACVSPCA